MPVKMNMKLLNHSFLLVALAVIFIATADVAFIEDQLPCGFGFCPNAQTAPNSRIHWIRTGNEFSGLENVLFTHAPGTTQNESHCAFKTARSIFSGADGTISKCLLTMTRDAQDNIRKKYEREYLASITEGGKNTISVPSRLKEWNYAVDPFHLETI
jgi:hypothetical protein